MSGISDFWDAHDLAKLMSETYGGVYEVGCSNGKYTVQRAPLSDTDMDPAFRRWRDAIYREFGVVE